MREKLILVFSLFAISSSVFAQHVPQTTYNVSTAPAWAKLMYESPEEVEAIRSGFEAWRTDHPLVKDAHTQYYKRWQRQAQWDKPEAYKRNAVRSGSWSEMGPWHYDPEVAMYFEVQSPGACHVYTVEQAPTNPDVVYCGTATSGLYKSINKGLNWELMTRDLPVTSVYSIAVSELDENVVWMGEGDGQLWKSIDGGASWETCGQNAFANSDKWYRTLKKTPEGLLAATDDGLWRSDDGGATMQLVVNGEFMEIEQHPTNSSIFYAVMLNGNTTRFYKSTDGGVSFTTSGAGWPVPASGSEQKRAEISVSLAAPDAVYALCSGSSDGLGGMYGYYVSHDAGETFGYACCGDGPVGGVSNEWVEGINPNILGWSGDGTGDGGQYYYDLAHGASPTNPNKQFSAGISVWRTEDEGASWSLNAHWVTWSGEFTHERYTHADVHDIKFFEGENGNYDMWVASDGGLYYSADEGDNIEPRMYGLHGTDFWGWQAGWRESEVMVGGTYHNGTHIRNGDLYHWGAESDTSGGWLAELAGDNYRGFVNPGDAEIGYHDGGAFKYSDDRFTRISGQAFDNSKNPNTGYWFGEYGNFEWDPVNYNSFYSPVGSELWRTHDGGVTWELVNDFGGDKIISIQISPRDRDRIYVSHKLGGSNWKIHMSSDRGATWEDISIPLGVSNYNQDRAIYLDTDGLNPDRLYAILLGTQDDYLVFQTQDAGQSWQNLTTPTLDNEHVISIAHQRGTEGGLYIGTNRTVYYKNDSMNDWEMFNDGLPLFTQALFLQADYCGGNIRTAGPRSVHQSPFYETSSVQAAFMLDQTQINLASPCDTPPVHFSDVSVVKCDGASYQWSFPGGSPSSASTPEAYVVYNEPGSYEVSLTVTNANGESDTITWTDLINVSNESVIGTTGIDEDFDGDAFPPAHWRLDCPGHPWEHAFDLTDETNGVAQFPNYWVQTNGAFDKLITPGLSPNHIEAIIFDYAHVKYSDYVEGLEVWAKLAGEDQWEVLWSAYGDDLTVDGCYTWFWYDTGGEIAWETVEILPPSHWADTDATCAEVAFVNVGDYGNHTWIDNARIIDSQSISTLSTTSLIVYPNPASSTLRISSTGANLASLQIFDMGGKLVYENSSQACISQASTVDASKWQSGIYFVSATTDNGSILSKKIIIQH